MANKLTATKDRGLRVLPEDNKPLKDERLGDYSKEGGRSIYTGFEYSEEFGQQKPMFFSREHNNFPLHGHYKGHSAFLCLSGPSFKNILDNHKDKLDRLFTMSTNNSIRSYRTDAWISVDDPTRFIKSCWLDPKIMKFIPSTHFEKTLWDSYTNEPLKRKVGECPNVYGFRRNNKFMANRWLTESTFNWGCHADLGGGRTVLLPAIKILYILGFRRIFLLGCDLNMNKNSKYHFDEERTKGAINCNKGTYKRIKEEYFPELKPYFDKAGLKVYNCNPDSALKVFPYMSFEEAYETSTSFMGDIDNEPTAGMYMDPKLKRSEYESRVAQKAQEENDRLACEAIRIDAKKTESISVINVTCNPTKTHCYKILSDKTKVRIGKEEFEKLKKEGF